LPINSSSVTDLNDIAEEFDCHFSTIGQSLATTTMNKGTSTAMVYLNNPCLVSIYLHSTSPYEVMSIINSLKQNKANGHDDIDPFFLKIAAPITAFPLSEILNHRKS